MITAEDLVLALSNDEEQKNFKLATVVDLFENDTAKIMFDGEDIASEKQYAYLSSYIPSEDDRVLLGAMGGTYIILGKVNYNVSPSTEEEVDRYLFDLKKVIIQKGLNVTLGVETDTLTVNNNTTLVGNVGVNGSVTATGLSATGNVTGNNITASGNVSANGNISATRMTISGLATTQDFHHRGSYISFFNRFQNVPRQNVPNLSGSADLTTIQNKLNALLSALRLYGLIG